MKWRRKFVSKKNIVIRKGTVFENIDGTNTHYASGNYEAIIGLDKDTCVTIVVNNENKEYFKEVVKGITEQIKEGAEVAKEEAKSDGSKM